MTPLITSLAPPRRRRAGRALPWLAALALAAASGCAGRSPSASSPPPARVAPATAAPGVTGSAPPPSTAATIPATVPTFPGRTAPAPLTPLVSPAVPGEGTWRPAVEDSVGGGTAIYTTTLRPTAASPPTGIAWINRAATRLALYAGTAEPTGSWPDQGSVPPSQQPLLLAAFNAGFKIYSYRTGWYEQGSTAVPLQTGAASFVIFSNGTATVADWGRDVSLGPTVAAVRQNLTLLVDGGVAPADVATPGSWGAVLHGGPLTWRSAVGVTAAGDLVYVAGPDLDPASLAAVLIAAGAQRAMELDINPQLVSFSLFIHAGGAAGGAVTGGSNLLIGMYYWPDHYLQPFSRDFFAVLAR